MQNNEQSLYKQARDLAWKILLDNHVSCLPVDVFALCEKYGIWLADNKKASEFLSLIGYDRYKIRQNAVILCPADRIVVVFDSNMEQADRRIASAAALGHFLLGHIPSGDGERLLEPVFTTEQKEQAYQFAVRLLMPLCVLRALGLNSSADIGRICEVPSTDAAKRLLRLRFIEYRNQKTGERTGQGVLYLSQYEKRLRSAFSAYIDQYKNNEQGEKDEG